ncbi:MAG: hypothetical protein A3F72_03590 [Bacteroidetes bacterium RIFCSPLOWO2_12_FULL_35_15]|nr:MAG: hypothetical protein A3F72_03590 [Bacteroidetes bacterium RIFCSPLOWO2_12_FULL_35_15]
MKKKQIHADKYQIRTQQRVTAAKVKSLEDVVSEGDDAWKGKSFLSLSKRLKASNQPCYIFALEEIRSGIQDGAYTTIEECKENRYFIDCNVIDKQQLVDIATVDLNKKSKKRTYVQKADGDWKSTDFICALENLQHDIQSGKYTTIEQCIENENLMDFDREDQEQLIDIANWYLYDTEQTNKVEADEVPEVEPGLSQKAINGLLKEAAEDPLKFCGENKATEMFAAILKQYPNAMGIQGNGYYYYSRGLGKSFKGDNAGAIEDFTKAIELEGDSLDGYNDYPYYLERGYSKFCINDYAGAKADLSIGATKSPTGFKMWKDANTNENDYLLTILNGISKRVKKQ